MANITLSASDKLSKEYCATIVKLGPVAPVEGSDFLGYTLVEGFPIVVRKDQVKEGDLMIYCQNESALNLDFLAANNSFDWENKEANRNYETEVKPLIDAGDKDSAKKKVGFINKYGRIKIIRLRGQVSMGILFPKSALEAWIPETSSINFEDYIGQDFDTVGKELFIKVYIPPVKPGRHTGTRPKRKDPAKKFNRMVEGQFAFHYDTQNLQRSAWAIRPEDTVSISVKFHGTSAIYANVLTKRPAFRTEFQKKVARWANRMITKEGRKWRLKLHQRFNQKYYRKSIIDRMPTVWNRKGWVDAIDFRYINYVALYNQNKPDVDVVYGNVYSSRTVIKNQFINKDVSDGYYGTDVWAEYNELLKDFIPQGYTIYGEICGYISGTSKMIQKDYDYGCNEGENFFMPYRITYKDGTSENKKEFNIKEVEEWTANLLKEHPELVGKIRPLEVLYHGKLEDRYPDVPVRDWNIEIIKRLEQDVEFGMEGLEPICTGHKVPREGFCLRIDNDPISECFKCKCKSFLFRESKEVDNGQVDIEMAEASRLLYEELVDLKGYGML